MKWLTFCIYFLSFCTFGQVFEYRLEGAFTPPVSLDNPLQFRATEEFVLNWNGVDGKVKGLYLDDRTVTPLEASGVSDINGTNFKIVYPREIRGIKQIAIQLPRLLNPTSGPMKVEMLFFDEANDVAYSSDFYGKFSHFEDPIEAIALERGVFSGTVLETADTGNNCALIDGPVAVHFMEDSRVRVILEEGQFHEVGIMPLNPLSSSVNVEGRYCGDLPEVRNWTGCKRLELEGSFGEAGIRKTFQGIYTITDELSFQTCVYNLTLSSDNTL